MLIPTILAAMGYPWWDPAPVVGMAAHYLHAHPVRQDSRGSLQNPITPTFGGFHQWGVLQQLDGLVHGKSMKIPSRNG